MPNGKRGDDPITDLLKHGIREFPDDICDSIIEINKIDPHAFEGDHEIGAVDWGAYSAKYGNWIGWSRESQFDAARAFLKDKLALAKAMVNGRDPSSDVVSTAIRTAFPDWAGHSVQNTFTTYPLNWPEANLAATRIHWDLFVRAFLEMKGHFVLVIETYPRPRVLIDANVIAEFDPGDAASTVEFLKTQPGTA